MPGKKKNQQDNDKKLKGEITNDGDAQMAKQQTGLTRNTIDKYYTKDSVVKLCIDMFQQYIQCSDNDIFIEPSAGNGAFINHMKKLSSNCLFYDLEPDHKDVLKQDYLDFKFDSSKKKNNKIHVIGNPPFGRQSSLAIKFIKKSSEFCDTISFILPRSFMKDSMRTRFPKNFHLLHEETLEEKSFIVNENDYNVPCIFQIWEKRYEDRFVNEKLEPQKFCFVKRNEKPDVSFRRVGINAGKLDRECENKSEQSHYFIKFSNPPSQIMYGKLGNISFECKNNTVGPKSISKQELIKEFNLILSA